MDTFKIINESVSLIFNVPISEMKGKSQEDHVVLARYAAMFLARNEFKQTLKRIGEMYSNRDHTTVMNAMYRCEELLGNNIYWSDMLNKAWENVKQKAYD